MLLKPTNDAIERAAQIIRSGGLVGIPTETVYGLAADALNPLACASIFAVKKRPHFDPLIVHVADRTMLDEIVLSVAKPLERLMDRFWPGPLTIVLPKREIIPEIVTSGLPTVAVRMPRHDVPQRLISLSGRPLAAPSANPFGYLSPTEAIHVEEQLGSEIGMIIDGGRCEVGVESTIVKLHDNMIYCLRPGGIQIEELSDTAGVEVIIAQNMNIPEVPGQLPSHYAPHAELILIGEGDPCPDDDGIALCAFRSNNRTNRFVHQEILSPHGNLNEAASNLFSALHRLDVSGAVKIYAEMLPERGIGIAIMNRLRKASVQTY